MLVKRERENEKEKKKKKRSKRKRSKEKDKEKERIYPPYIPPRGSRGKPRPEFRVCARKVITYRAVFHTE